MQLIPIETEILSARVRSWAPAGLQLDPCLEAVRTLAGNLHRRKRYSTVQYLYMRRKNLTGRETAAKMDRCVLSDNGIAVF